MKSLRDYMNMVTESHSDVALNEDNAAQNEMAATLFGDIPFKAVSDGYEGYAEGHASERVKRLIPHLKQMDFLLVNSDQDSQGSNWVFQGDMGRVIMHADNVDDLTVVFMPAKSSAERMAELAGVRY